MTVTDQRRVERRAYAIWDAEGQPHGRHEEHWHLAERELAAEKAAAAAQPKRARTAAKPAAAKPAAAKPAAAALPARLLRRKAAAVLSA